jgi:dual-specificity kinase
VVECVDPASRVPVAVKVVRALKKYADTAAGELQILQRLMEHDPGDRIAFIRPLSHFMVDGHMCIVFPRLGLSLYDFLKNNRYIGFCLRDVFAIAQATLQCIEYIHGLGLIHTDLKPENILLEDDGFDELPNGAGRVPKCNRIRIIDFGSSIWESQPHAKLIQTRHYRAPEVVLGMGWSFPCDLWSVGCILAELLTGHALFQTHDSREHLHIMARVLGPFPRWFSQMADSECGRWFKPDGKLEPLDPKSDSAQFVAKLKPLRELIGKYPDFCDLVTKLLHYEPRNRLSAKQALAHAFFY